jgi:hypothetical protein
VRVLGTRAAYVKSDADGQEAALRAGVRPDRPDWGVEAAARWGVLSAGGETRPVPSEPVPISATMLESSPRYSRRPSRPSIPKTR